MQKYNIVLDTNIYRKNPSRTDLPFQALERLCRANIVRLHLPYIVEREFQTQQCALYRKDLDTATSAINALLRRGLSPELAARVEAIRDELTANTQPVLTDVESAIQIWANTIGASRHQITEQQARAAMESYFNGHPPLTVPKTREDIPDAFIFQTIMEISREPKPLTVIAEDEKIARAAESVPGITVYRNLSGFIESAPIQAELLELDVIDKLPAISSMIEDFEKQTGELTSVLSRSGGPKIVWKKIYSASIPDDNHEAVITGYGDPQNIELDFGEIYYFGNGEFGLPFRFSSTVSGTYYIFKADYYCLDDNNMPSVSDHNDHYFEAEEDFDVDVSGLLRLSIDIGQLDTLSAENIDEHIQFDIDSIDAIDIDE